MPWSADPPVISELNATRPELFMSRFSKEVKRPPVGGAMSSRAIVVVRVPSVRKIAWVAAAPLTPAK